MTSTPLRAVAAIRMSGAKQEHSPERQRQLFAEYCAKWNLEPVGEYEDLAVSATHTTMADRPGIMRLWADAAAGKFDVVWAEETSRAGRNMIETLQLEQYLQAQGVAFCDHHDDPHHKVDPLYRSLITAVKAWQDQAETWKLSERMKRDQHVWLSEGKSVGGVYPAGLRWDKETKAWLLDPAFAALPRRTFELFPKLRCYQRVAEQLNAEGYRGKRGAPISVSTVKQMLAQSAYRGVITRGGRQYRVDLPEVVPPALVAEVDALLDAQRGRRQRTLQAKGLYVGVLRCPHCGGWYTIIRNCGRSPRYRCSRAYQASGACGHTESVAEWRVEEVLLPLLSRELRAMAARLKVTERPQRKRQMVAAVNKQLDLSRARARQMYVDGLISREELEQEFARLDGARQVVEVEKEEVPAVTTAQLREAAEALEKHWRAWDTERRRNLLLALVSYVEWYHPSPEHSRVVWRHEHVGMS